MDEWEDNHEEELSEVQDVSWMQIESEQFQDKIDLYANEY